MTIHEHAHEVAAARRAVVHAGARLRHQLDLISTGSPFEIHYVERLLGHTQDAVRLLAHAEQQARKGQAA